MSVPVRTKNLKLWTFVIFCEILSRLRKNVEVMLAFGELLEAHFGAPKNCKSWALVRTRAQFWQCSLTFVLQFLFCKNSKKTWKLSSRSNESSTFADPFHEKKRSMHLYKVSPFCDFCETPLVYGGVRVARNAAHSTSAATVKGFRPHKKSMGKSKKSTFTDKHSRVTTWSLTSRLKKHFFYIFW